MGLYDQCRLFSSLPRAGGVLDQDNYETSMIEHALFIRSIAGIKSEIKASKALKPAQLAIWKKLKATET